MEKPKDISDLPKSIKPRPMPTFISRSKDYGDDYSDQEWKQIRAWNEELKSNHSLRR
jgi:hypothetical protein